MHFPLDEARIAAPLDDQARVALATSFVLCQASLTSACLRGPLLAAMRVLLGHLPPFVGRAASFALDLLVQTFLHPAQLALDGLYEVHVVGQHPELDVAVLGAPGEVGAGDQ